MIKIGSTVLGAKHLNFKAKMMKDTYSGTLKGMKCNKCKTNSFIDFTTDGKHVNVQSTYCCKEFQDKANLMLNALLER